MLDIKALLAIAMRQPRAKSDLHLEPDLHWELWTKEAPDYIKQSWPGIALIVELITTAIKRSVRRHQFITMVRTSSKALLRLIRHR